MMRHWMFAKEWIDVQRAQRLQTMSRKLAGGSQQSLRKREKDATGRSHLRQGFFALLALGLGAVQIDLARPDQSLLMAAVGKNSSKTDLDKAQAHFPSLQNLPGPGTALGLPPSKASAASIASRTGSNGLLE